MSDPATEKWREAMDHVDALLRKPLDLGSLGESTSAALRRTQQALAASQADLTRMEQELDEARHALAHACFQLAMERLRREYWQGLAQAARTEGGN